jgi:YesN/AraC family two-component response regulator
MDSIYKMAGCKKQKRWRRSYKDALTTVPIIIGGSRCSVLYLAYSDLSTKEIAFALGFSDPSHFSKIFKQVAKFSPTQFKLRLKANV